MDEEIIETERQVFLSEVIGLTIKFRKSQYEEIRNYAKNLILSSANSGGDCAWLYPNNGWNDKSGMFRTMSTKECNELIVFIRDEGFKTEWNAVNQYWTISWGPVSQQ